MTKSTGTKSTRSKAAATRAAAPPAAAPQSAGAKSAATKTSGTKLGRRGSGGAPPTVATPWGRASLVERLSVPQRAGDRRFASAVELLESGDGERLVRIAYSTDGIVRRGPVTLRLRDLVRLRESANRVPELADALGWNGRPTSGGQA